MDKVSRILGGVLSTTKMLEALAFLPEKSVVCKFTTYLPSSLKESSALFKVESEAFSFFQLILFGRILLSPVPEERLLELATAVRPSTLSGVNI